MKVYTRKLLNNNLLPAITVVIIAIFAVFLYMNQTHGFLRFSDGAKFADIARNMHYGRGYVSSFNFFNTSVVSQDPQRFYDAYNVPKLFPYTLYISFSLFGINDISAISVSVVYYLLSVLLSYCIALKLHSKTAGLISASIIAFNINLLDYATSVASETAIVFLFLFAIYLIIQKKSITTAIAFTLLPLIYISRPQSIIYITALLVMYLLGKFTIKKTALIIIFIVALFIALDQLILTKLLATNGYVSYLNRGINAISAHQLTSSPSLALQGIETKNTSFFEIPKKLFYNSYNFYRRIPDIFSPYVFIFFIIGIFVKYKDRFITNTFIVATLALVASLISASLTIPFFRYIHPMIPLIYICGTICLLTLTKNISYQKIIVLLILSIFAIGPTLGVLIIDSRFKSERVNSGKPPVYVLLSRELQKRTKESDVILTNLDTWGSWYGNRKTIWLPYDAGVLEDIEEPKYTVIYLTDYMADDDNYALGPEWKITLNSTPETVAVIDGFTKTTEIFIDKSSNYENIDARAVLLIKE